MPKIPIFSLTAAHWPRGSQCTAHQSRWNSYSLNLAWTFSHDPVHISLMSHMVIFTCVVVTGPSDRATRSRVCGMPGHSMLRPRRAAANPPRNSINHGKDAVRVEDILCRWQPQSSKCWRFQGWPKLRGQLNWSQEDKVSYIYDVRNEWGEGA